MPSETRTTTRWPAIVHRWRQEIPNHFTGYGLTDATRAMFTARAMRVVVDPNMPSDEVHFRDRDGNMVGKIINIGSRDA